MLDPLDRSDFETRTWARLTEHIQTRLLALRTQNESDLDATATARLRGRIAQLKELLELSKEGDPAHE